MNIKKEKLLLLFILSITLSFNNIFAADIFYRPAINNTENLGAPPGTCDTPAIYGNTVEEVGRRSIAISNAKTGPTCGGQCRNPAEFISADELNQTFKLKSLCGGYYTVNILKIINPKQTPPGNSPDTPAPCPDCTTGNPVHPATGQKFQLETDYTGTQLKFIRIYSSIALNRIMNDRLGKKWRHNYDKQLVIIENTGFTNDPTLGHSIVNVWRENGQILEFVLDETTNLWLPDPDVTTTLTELKDTQGVRLGWTYLTQNDLLETYDLDGKLISQTNRNNQVTSLIYDLDSSLGGDDNPDTLDKITDHFGRSLTLTYDSSGRIYTLVDPDGNEYLYQYDANNNLTKVFYPDDTPADYSDNPKRQYHYEKSGFPNHLTGITNENNERYATWVYDNEGRVITSEHANGVEQVTLTYNADGTTTVQESQGAISTYHFTTQYGVDKPMQVTGDQCSSCGKQYADIIYDANGFVASLTDFNGNVTTYIHDAHGLELSRTEAVGTPQERTITTEWHPTFRLPTKITEPGKITTFTYDAQGRLLERNEETAP